MATKASMVASSCASRPIAITAAIKLRQAPSGSTCWGALKWVSRARRRVGAGRCGCPAVQLRNRLLCVARAVIRVTLQSSWRIRLNPNAAQADYAAPITMIAEVGSPPRGPSPACRQARKRLLSGGRSVLNHQYRRIRSSATLSRNVKRKAQWDASTAISKTMVPVTQPRIPITNDSG